MNTPALGQATRLPASASLHDADLGFDCAVAQRAMVCGCGGRGTAHSATRWLTASLVYLHNNRSEDVSCEIEYYTQNGVWVGRLTRAQKCLPSGEFVAGIPAGGGRSGVGAGRSGSRSGPGSPNRPMGTDNGNDDKKNGAIVVRWTGSPYDLQGVCATYASPEAWNPTTENRAV